MGSNDTPERDDALPPLPEQVPIPPDILAAIIAEYERPEVLAELQDMLDGKAKRYTIDEVLAEIWAAAGVPQPK
jgi:hypothetical protein